MFGIPALILLGCAKEVGDGAPDFSKPVQFTTSSVNEYVFKSTEGALATGDYIGVFAGNPISRNNVKMRVNGSALEYTNDADRIYWGTGQTTASNFVAYEPWIADGSFSNLANKQRTWTVQSNQSSDANFNASDLKVANVDVDSEDEVELAFNHILAKVTITITSELASTISQVELLNVISTGIIDLDDSTVSSPGAANSTVVAHQKSYNSGTKVYVYEAIVIPQSGANPSIRVTVEGGTTYTYELSSSVNLTSGANATAAFTISRPGLAAAFTSLSVSSWGAGSSGTVNTSGRSVNRQTGKWAIVGNIMGTDWDEDIYMSNTGSNEWSVDIYYNPGEIFLFRYNNTWIDECVIGAKKSLSGEVTPGTDYVVKYRTDFYTYDGEEKGTKDLMISGSAGWYTVYLHPFTAGDSNWPYIYIATK